MGAVGRHLRGKEIPLRHAEENPAAVHHFMDEAATSPMEACERRGNLQPGSLLLVSTPPKDGQARICTSQKGTHSNLQTWCPPDGLWTMVEVLSDQTSTCFPLKYDRKYVSAR